MLDQALLGCWYLDAVLGRGLRDPAHVWLVLTDERPPPQGLRACLPPRRTSRTSLPMSGSSASYPDPHRRSCLRRGTPPGLLLTRWRFFPRGRRCCAPPASRAFPPQVAAPPSMATPRPAGKRRRAARPPPEERSERRIRFPVPHPPACPAAGYAAYLACSHSRGWYP